MTMVSRPRYPMLIRLGLLLASASLVSCAHYRGSSDIGSCYHMHTSTSDIQELSEQIAELEKRSLELSRDAEKHREAIGDIGKLIAYKRKRIDDLEKESRRQERDCDPMFEDPAAERARDRGYRKD